jgi:hypothetical protein
MKKLFITLTLLVSMSSFADCGQNIRIPNTLSELLWEVQGMDHYTANCVRAEFERRESEKEKSSTESMQNECRDLSESAEVECLRELLSNSTYSKPLSL